MSARVEGKFKGSIDDKRFYLPGVCVLDNCPKCGKREVMDLGRDPYYLSYPIVGKPQEIVLCCDKCGCEWEVQVRLDVTLTVLESA